MSKSCRILSVLSAVVLIAATIVPMASAFPQAGQIIFYPTHAPPGALVTFEGVGWDLPNLWFSGSVITCIILGEPVKVDIHAVCETRSPRGEIVPVGSFIVADVPPGVYPVTVTLGSGLGPGKDPLATTESFTVDAVTPTTVTTTTVKTLTTSQAATAVPPTSVVTITATVTTTKVETPQVLDSLLAIVAISLVAILTVLFLRSRHRVNSQDRT